MANAHLGSVGLSLEETELDVYKVVLRPGSEWRDTAYYLGHMANLRTGRMVRSRGVAALGGPERHFTDLRAAVLGNLAVLATPPEGGQDKGSGSGLPGGPRGG